MFALKGLNARLHFFQNSVSSSFSIKYNEKYYQGVLKTLVLITKKL